MTDARIARIADLAGVDYSIAHNWIVDPDGDWSNAAEPTSANEHAAWIAQASDEEIADWISAGQVE